MADDTMSDLSPVTLDRISISHTLFVKKKTLTHDAAMHLLTAVS